MLFFLNIGESACYCVVVWFLVVGFIPPLKGWVFALHFL